MNKRNAFMLIAKQSARGTAAATGFYKVPLKSGGASSEKTHEEERETGKVGAAASVTSIKHSIKGQCVSYKDILPLFAYSILGAIATTGTTDKTHAITEGTAALPRLTVIMATADDAGTYTYDRYVDVLVDEVKWASEKAVGNCYIDFSGRAESVTYGVTLPTVTTDLTAAGKGKFLGLGGVVKFSPTTSTPADITSDFEKLTITWKRDVDELIKYATGNVAVDEKFLSTEVAFSMVATSALYRKILSGSDAGTSPSGALVEGSFEPTLKASDSANHTVVANITKAVWKMNSFEADPEGGRWIADISTDTGGAVTALTVINAIAAY